MDPGMGTHVFNPSIPEAEAGEPSQAQGQPGLVSLGTASATWPDCL